MVKRKRLAIEVEPVVVVTPPPERPVHELLDAAVEIGAAEVLDPFIPRPGSSYRPEYARIAQILCSRGAVDHELAEAFRVSTATIGNWKSMYPEFGEAVRHGKANVFDPLVERALAQRALGYAVDVDEVKWTRTGPQRVTVRKHYPPDVGAAVFWLKNRQPDKWRDVHTFQHEGPSLNELTADQLREEVQREAAALGLLGLPDDVSKH